MLLQVYQADAGISCISTLRLPPVQGTAIESQLSSVVPKPTTRRPHKEGNASLCAVSFNTLELEPIGPPSLAN